MSGMSRKLSAGTPGPVCQAGLGKRIDAPAPVSFQTISGIYETAEAPLALLVAFQYWPPDSLNCVPPTAVTSGKLAGMITAGPSDTVVAFPVVLKKPCGSQPAAPESPEEATQVMPWALACCAISRVPTPPCGSHTPKLSLITLA